MPQRSSSFNALLRRQHQSSTPSDASESSYSSIGSDGGVSIHSEDSIHGDSSARTREIAGPPPRPRSPPERKLHSSYPLPTDYQPNLGVHLASIPLSMDVSPCGHTITFNGDVLPKETFGCPYCDRQYHEQVTLPVMGTWLELCNERTERMGLNVERAQYFEVGARQMQADKDVKISRDVLPEPTLPDPEGKRRKIDSRQYLYSRGWRAGSGLVPGACLEGAQKCPDPRSNHDRRCIGIGAEHRKAYKTCDILNLSHSDLQREDIVFHSAGLLFANQSTRTAPNQSKRSTAPSISQSAGGQTSREARTREWLAELSISDAQPSHVSEHDTQQQDSTGPTERSVPQDDFNRPATAEEVMEAQRRQAARRQAQSNRLQKHMRRDRRR